MMKEHCQFSTKVCTKIFDKDKLKLVFFLMCRTASSFWRGRTVDYKRVTEILRRSTGIKKDYVQ